MRREPNGDWQMRLAKSRLTTTALAIGGVWSGAVLAASGTSAQVGRPGQSGPDTSAVLLRGETQQALGLLSNSLKEPSLTNDRRATLLNDRGIAYMRLGQHKLAIEDYNRAAQLFPEHAPVYNNRGTTLLALGLPREAARDFDRAILLAPGYAAAYNNRASAHLLLGQPAEAIKDYSKAIELMPSSPAPLAGRGRAFLKQDRPFAAMRDFSRALQSDARFSAAYRARAEAKTAVERYEDAVEDLSRAAAFEPANAEILILRGNAYLMSRNTASAIKDFTRAIELEPRSVAAFLGRGLAHARGEALDEAETDLARALELDPRSASAFAYRAFVYKLSGQIDLAEKELDKALKLDAARAEVLWARAEIEEINGKTEEAVASFRAALAARPGLREATDGLERLGAGQAATENEIAGLGIDKWRVVARSGRYFATTSLFPKLRVPLEMTGEGQPKLLEWEQKKGSHKNIGVLRFASGRAPIGSSTATVEQVAIVDLQAASVLAVHIHRHGDQTSKWTWDDDKIVIASLDGVTEEIQIRSKAKDDGKEVAAAASAQRRVSAADTPQKSGGGGTPSWAPWAQSTWSGSNDNRSRGAPPRQQKPKSFFDLLFGN